jgi:RNA polymerase sigma-70 factor (ECF subfamily)
VADDGRTDLELVQAVRRGDAAAFEALYRRYRDWVVSLAFGFCGNREDALDVLQETFAYFFRKAPDFELRAKFKTFLYPVVKHLALRQKEKSRRPAPPAAVAAGPAPPSSVEELIAGLSEEQQEIVRLRFADDLSLQEIAEALEIPVGTVKSRLHAAIENLRRNRRTFEGP